MLDTLANVRLVLLISKSRGCFANRMEIIRLHISLVHRLHQCIQLSIANSPICLRSLIIISGSLFAIPFAQSDKLHRIIEMIKHDDVLIHNIIDIRRIILCHRGILYRDILEVAYCIKGRESIKSTEILPLSLNMETLDELIESLRNGELTIFSLSFTKSWKLLFFNTAIRISLDNLSMTHGNASQWMYTNKGTGIFRTMVVATLHQSRLGVNISQSHINSHRRIEVGENRASYCRIIKLSHFFLLIEL